MMLAHGLALYSQQTGKGGGVWSLGMMLAHGLYIVLTADLKRWWCMEPGYDVSTWPIALYSWQT